jgi:hypothetical protein
MNTTTSTVEPKLLPTEHVDSITVIPKKSHCDASSDALGDTRSVNSVENADSVVLQDSQHDKKVIHRGLAETMSTAQLKNRIWLRALLTANRFRVIRTIDIAVCCFAERPYKAALTAAQRAVRGMVKAGLLKRYRTDRFQTVYGLTQRGVHWLEDAGHEASSSVRRVSDMTNPEHRLWAQFWVLACESRGMYAMTEQELLQHLNKGKKAEQPLVQGLLTIRNTHRGKTTTSQLRPDAVATDSRDSAGTVWLEVDRSKRGSDREASLGALVSSVGNMLGNGTYLRRVVIFCKTDRIQKRALSIIQSLASANNALLLGSGRRHYREIEPGIFAVWTAKESKLSGGLTRLVDTLVGYINVQMLPIWLPKVRIDKTNRHSLAGWLDENYLPYQTAPTETNWPKTTSPLLLG